MVEQKRRRRWPPVVYSLVVFPGLGQASLGRKGRGAIFALLSILFLMIWIIKFIGPFQQLVTSRLVLLEQTNPDTVLQLMQITKTWLGLLMVTWLVSGIDTFILAGRDDIEDPPRKRKPQSEPKFYYSRPKSPPPPTPPMDGK